MELVTFFIFWITIIKYISMYMKIFDFNRVSLKKVIQHVSIVYTIVPGNSVAICFLKKALMILPCN